MSNLLWKPVHISTQKVSSWTLTPQLHFASEPIQTQVTCDPTSFSHGLDHPQHPATTTMMEVFLNILC